MRLPRDLSGARLATLLGRYGYEVVRQSGSHLRLTRNDGNSTYHLTIPDHRAIKIGLLAAIVTEVAGQLGRSRDEFSEELFG
ncbi:MAG: type II toxin-antitoxin system HicA family toxin [Dehalococcoidia bacterium]